MANTIKLTLRLLSFMLYQWDNKISTVVRNIKTEKRERLIIMEAVVSLSCVRRVILGDCQYKETFSLRPPCQSPYITPVPARESQELIIEWRRKPVCGECQLKEKLLDISKKMQNGLCDAFITVAQRKWGLYQIGTTDWIF